MFRLWLEKPLTGSNLESLNAREEKLSIFQWHCWSKNIKTNVKTNKRLLKVCRYFWRDSVFNSRSLSIQIPAHYKNELNFRMLAIGLWIWSNWSYLRGLNKSSVFIVKFFSESNSKNKLHLLYLSELWSALKFSVS